MITKQSNTKGSFQKELSSRATEQAIKALFFIYWPEIYILYSNFREVNIMA